MTIFVLTSALGSCIVNESDALFAFHSGRDFILVNVTTPTSITFKDIPPNSHVTIRRSNGLITTFTT